MSVLLKFTEHALIYLRKKKQAKLFKQVVRLETCMTKGKVNTIISKHNPILLVFLIEVYRFYFIFRIQPMLELSFYQSFNTCTYHSIYWNNDSLYLIFFLIFTFYVMTDTQMLRQDTLQSIKWIVGLSISFAVNIIVIICLFVMCR